MKINFLILSLVLSSFGYSQSAKPAINDLALSNWPSLEFGKFSNDGRYAIYTVIDNISNIKRIYIRASDNSYSKEMSYHGRDPLFTEDSRRLIFINPGDSLCIVEPTIDQISFVPNVHSFKTPELGNGQYLAYLLKSRELVLFDLISKGKTKFANVSDYSFSRNGRILVRKVASHENTEMDSLKLTTTSTRASCSIWGGVGLKSFTIDNAEDKIVFLVKGNTCGQPANSIWYYDFKMNSANVLVDCSTPGMQENYAILNSGLKFSSDGKKVFFNIYDANHSVMPDSGSAAIDVWSYKDEFLQSDQLKLLPYENTRSFIAVIEPETRIVYRLEFPNDGMWGSSKMNEGNNDNYLLTEKKVDEWGQGYRLPKERPSIFLINTHNGFRRLIKQNVLEDGPAIFSPRGKYVFWYDRQVRAYFTFNIETGVTVDVSSRLPVRVYDEQSDLAMAPNSYGLAVWTENDASVLIYDRYDLWELDPGGKKPAISVTNGYGRKHKIILRYVYHGNLSRSLEQPIKSNSKIVLCGLNERNKNNGFYKTILGKSGSPVQLLMSAKLYYFSDQTSAAFSDQCTKARDSEIFMVKCMTASDYPVIEITNNFRDFKSISDICPQKQFNWLTSSIVHWNTFDGRRGDGILYKPENFSSNKKYPIIFYFYERLSDGLNKFIDADLSSGPMNIPWFVSRGYLVFCPDIYYLVGAPGPSVYNYVVSAAIAMGKLPWVNKNSMGIQGHSWGGYEVNYLVTRTNLFAAAASANGQSDFVSASGGLFAGSDSHPYFEQYQPRMGATLWQNPGIYINNSPIFRANRVTTPLLIMHNKQDPAVSWLQGIEFFTALRRLGKRAWLLQYDNGRHVLNNYADEKDYTTRLTQFFDHYLKGMPEPKWMSEGIPANLKGIDLGLEMTTEGNSQ